MDLAFGRSIRYYNFFFKKNAIERFIISKSIMGIPAWFPLGKKRHIVIEKCLSDLVHILHVCRFSAVWKKAIPVFKKWRGRCSPIAVYRSRKEARGSTNPWCNYWGKIGMGNKGSTMCTSMIFLLEESIPMQLSWLCSKLHLSKI